MRGPQTTVWQRTSAVALILGLALVALAAASVSTSAAAGVTSRRLDAYLEEQVANSPLPGLAVVVTHGEDVVHLEGYGTAGDGRAMTPHTALRIASLSKAFTAVAVLQLVEEGLLDLDAPVQRYLPGFTLADDSTAARITVRHLLHHTSGLTDQGFPGLWHLDEHSPAERVASLADARTSTEPGEAFSYFNPNYEVLARLVEVASGEDFDDYLQRHVFTPLGMADTVSVTRAEDAATEVPGLAQGHVVVFGIPIARAEPDGYVGGSGGVVTTAADLSRWLPAHTNAGTVRGHRVLDAESVDLAHAPPTDLDSPYAMGWMAATSGGHPTLEHTGVSMTVYAEQVLLPETGHGVVLLANANHALGDVPRIKEGVVAVLSGESPASPLLTHRRVVALVTVLLVVGLVVRVHGIRHRHRWARRRAHGPAWLRWLGILRLLLPALLLAGLPTLVGVTAGRVFPLQLLAPAVPELVAWLAVASCTGLALAAARMAALRQALSLPPAGPGGGAGRRAGAAG